MVNRSASEIETEISLLESVKIEYARHLDVMTFPGKKGRVTCDEKLRELRRELDAVRK